MWAKIITIKRTKDLNYFSLCALNLFNSRVSQFELNYWNKWTFPRHSNLLICTCILGMCISISESHTIPLSMHSQRYNTFKIDMKQLAMRCNTIHPYYDAVEFDFDPIQHDSMQCDTIKKYINFLFFGSVRQRIINERMCLFIHKTSLQNRPGLLQLVWLIVKLFGSIKQNEQRSTSVTVATYAGKLT